jgi:hypothetical protein
VGRGGAKLCLVSVLSFGGRNFVNVPSEHDNETSDDLGIFLE